MKSRSQLPQLILLFIALTTMFACETRSQNHQYDIAAQQYGQLTEQYLQHIANFEWEDSYALLSDDVEFKLPDGDTDTRTTFKGLAEVSDFWNNYVKNSGNDKASFKDFVHVPVQVNEMIDHVDATGAFNLCYFSAELSYGEALANVRMHWAFHFNQDKKIDGIYAYYDRTPIIEAARRNFLTTEHSGNVSNDKVVQVIKIKSQLTEQELLKLAKERAAKFSSIPGLLQKYYVRLNEGDQYGGVYVWESEEAMKAYKESDLAASIAQAYKVVGAPSVEISEVLFQLRD